MSVRRAAPYRLVGEVVREHPLQRQIADVFRLELCREGHVSIHGVCWFSTDIAGYGGDVPGARIGRGVIAGIPDMWLLYRGHAYLLEVKAVDGSLSIPQREMALAAVMVGCRYGVVRDAPEAVACLDEWQIPRSHRTDVRPMRVSGGVA